MGFNVSAKSDKQFAPCPAGVYAAWCYGVVDLGTQPDTWKGKPKDSPKIRIFFELPTVKETFDKDVGPEPRTVSKKYTKSLSDKAHLRADLVSWRGKQFTEEELKNFDISKLLKAPALVTIVHDKKDDKVYANIASITTLPKEMKSLLGAGPANTPFLYSVDEKTSGAYDDLPEWVQEECKKAREFKLTTPSDHGGSGTEASDEPPTGQPEEDCPF
jgi:hypothetical protein